MFVHQSLYLQTTLSKLFIFVVTERSEHVLGNCSMPAPPRILNESWL